MQSPPVRRMYYGWVVVGVVFTAIIMAAGLRALPGPLMKPLEDEFGWDRATISIAVSLNLLLFGLLGPLVGRVTDRHGPKPVMLAGLVAGSVGVLGITVSQTPWQLWLLWGVLGGMGAGASTGVVVATVASRWFTKRRGLVVGILSAAMSAGQLVFLPLVMAMIVFQGWRAAVGLVAGAVLVIALPLVAVFMKNDPKDAGQTIEGGTPGTPGAMPVAVAVYPATQSPFRTFDFWLLASSYFVCGFTTLGLIGTHLIPHALDHGIPEVATASLLGVMGFMNFVGTTAAGWLSDRFDKRKLLAVIYCLRGLSLVALPFLGDVTTLAIFAVVYGLDWIATVPPTVGLCADLYGRLRVGSVYGWVLLSHQVGAAAAAYLGGVSKVALGDYGFAFMGAGILALLAVVMSLRVTRPVRQPDAVAPVSASA